MGEKKSALEAFLYSLTMDVPRAEICCEVGKIFLERELPRQAAYWYGQALTVPSEDEEKWVDFLWLSDSWICAHYIACFCGLFSE